MSTTFIRWANRARFEIRNSTIDCTTDDVEILDYAKAEPDSLYYVRNNWEYERKRIADADFNKKIIGTTMYRLTDDQAQVLADKGEAIAIDDYGSTPIKVYLASAAAKLLERLGNESLARCYAKLAEAREQYKHKQSLQQALLAAANGQPIKQSTNDDTLAADIKVFLENRDKCLAALKTKRKRSK
jgi:hypothetical protein